MARHVFVSYSHRDRSYVERLVNHLTSCGVPVWTDGGVSLGPSWETLVNTRIDTCNAFVTVVSRHSEASPWVRRELARAKASDTPILSLVLSEGPAVPDGHYERVTDGGLPGAEFVDELRRLASKDVA